MLYETVWMIYALGVSIFLSIGLLGLTFSPSIVAKPISAPVFRRREVIAACDHCSDNL